MKPSFLPHAWRNNDAAPSGGEKMNSYDFYYFFLRAGIKLKEKRGKKRPLSAAHEGLTFKNAPARSFRGEAAGGGCKKEDGGEAWVHVAALSPAATPAEIKR